ncbi:MAG TPA: undecaprenyldiphospho-muramoylpentapeptide beta-N-acetylglucosaminyltransferase [Gammaproteobacteria bacterium]|nr:undecaprenyldiphospho-muramoylpentapeptide beta-N-acetylglucosaminyltransferase [Gammaproteobacteria bacterium]
MSGSPAMAGAGPAGPVMIMAGGTGGHVFPGLAVAEALRSRSVGVVWLGTRRGLEARLVPPHGIEIEWISIAGLRGKGFAAWLAAPFRLALALGQSLSAERRRRPSAVLGLGGFVSGPGGIAARLRGKPLLIHEQNAVAGTANRGLARFASRVFEAFPGSFPAGVAAECIGNPVRESIEALAPPASRFAARAAARPRLLVLGGSQGARALNRALPAALASLAPAERPEVRHQAGAAHAETDEAYRRAGVEARVDAFIDDMAEAYAWADFAVARAGALTISELAAAGLGALLVPYPHATDDHQTKNAAHMAAASAAIVISESELDSARLAADLGPLMADRSRLLAMAEAARRLARPGAAQRLAEACIELAEGRA